jgi:hypothetical protein
VLQLFLDAVDEFGMPSRTRGDRGGENLLIATYAVMRNGPNRGSFMWGPYVPFFKTDGRSRYLTFAPLQVDK